VRAARPFAGPARRLPPRAPHRAVSPHRDSRQQPPAPPARSRPRRPASCSVHRRRLLASASSSRPLRPRPHAVPPGLSDPCRPYSRCTVRPRPVVPAAFPPPARRGRCYHCRPYPFPDRSPLPPRPRCFPPPALALVRRASLDRSELPLRGPVLPLPPPAVPPRRRPPPLPSLVPLAALPALFVASPPHLHFLPPTPDCDPPRLPRLSRSRLLSFCPFPAPRSGPSPPSGGLRCLYSLHL